MSRVYLCGAVTGVLASGKICRTADGESIPEGRLRPVAQAHAVTTGGGIGKRVS